MDFLANRQHPDLESKVIYSGIMGHFTTITTAKIAENEPNSDISKNRLVIIGDKVLILDCV